MPLDPAVVILIRRALPHSTQVTRSNHPKRHASIHEIIFNRSRSASSHRSSRNHALTRVSILRIDSKNPPQSQKPSP
jgi:hypothetical protein